MKKNSFKEAFLEYKLENCISVNQTINIKDFKLWLENKKIHIDKSEFIEILIKIGEKSQNFPVRLWRIGLRNKNKIILKPTNNRVLN